MKLDKKKHWYVSTEWVNKPDRTAGIWWEQNQNKMKIKFVKPDECVMCKCIRKLFSDSKSLQCTERHGFISILHNSHTHTHRPQTLNVSITFDLIMDLLVTEEKSGQENRRWNEKPFLFYLYSLDIPFHM